MTRAELGNGPWGEAIRYWLIEKKVSQADLADSTSMPPNTISRAARGLDCNTGTLRTIAESLQVPFEDVLLSPTRRRREEEQTRIAQEIAFQVMKGQKPVSNMVYPTGLKKLVRTKKVRPATDIDEVERDKQRFANSATKLLKKITSRDRTSTKPEKEKRRLHK